MALPTKYDSPTIVTNDISDLVRNEPSFVNANDRLKGATPIDNTIIQKLLYSSDTPQDMTIEQFILYFNAKIDEFKNKTLKNNIMQNKILDLGSHLLCDLRFNQDITVGDIEIPLPENDIKILSSFIFKNFIIIISNLKLYYINITDILNKNYNYKEILLIDIEPEAVILDVLFQSNYFVIITKNKNIFVKYSPSSLEITPTKFNGDYLNKKISLFDGAILNDTKFNDVMYVSYLDVDSWRIDKFNKRIYSDFNTDISNIEISDTVFDIDKTIYFNIDYSDVDTQITTYIIKNDNKFMLYEVEFNWNTRITSNITITNISFLFDKLLLQNIISFNNAITISNNGDNIVYFTYNNFVWKMKLKSDDSEIEQLFSIPQVLKAVKYDNQILYHTIDGTYIIQDKSYLKIKNQRAMLNSTYSYTSDTITIKPLCYFTINNIDGVLQKVEYPMIFFYLIDGEIQLSNIYSETTTMLGMFDRRNNYMLFKEVDY